MQKTWLGLALLAGLSAPLTARAADGTTVGVGTGAVAGALVGGPIGAVVGAIAGGVIGANSDEARPRYRRHARKANRRRAEIPQAPPRRTRLAERGAPVDQVASPRRTSSEIDSTARPETTGSTPAGSSSGWQDPR